MNRRQENRYSFLDPAKFEVLDNLLLESGHQAQWGMIDDILCNPRINLTVLIGEGGGGKSSILAQLFRAVREIQDAEAPLPTDVKPGQETLVKKIIFRRLNKRILNTLLPFDWFVNRVVEKKGGRHQSLWQPEEWHSVSEEILSTMGPKLQEVRSHNKGYTFYGKGPRWHLASDPVVLGDLDKGREAVKVVAKQPDVRLMGLVSDPENKSRAIRLREAVIQTGLAPETIEQIFISEGIELDIDDFGRVPGLMKKMATKNLMNVSDMQVEAQIERMISDGINLDDFPLPEEVEARIEKYTPQDRLDDKIGFYRRRFPHMIYVLRKQLEVPQPRVHVLFNVNMTDKVIHWYQRDLEQAMGMNA